MQEKSQYKTQIADEETKLRWLITRQPSSLELRYYLLFLLAANERYAKAIKECQRILESHPDDVIAHVWAEALLRKWLLVRCRRRIQRRRTLRGGRLWRRVRCRDM